MLLAEAGYRTYGVDRAFAVLSETRAHFTARAMPLYAWCADLTSTSLPQGFFDVIVVTRYLQRDLSQAISRALVPGGVLIYETFTERQRQHGRGPRSPHHLLRAGELRQLFPDLDVMSYEEVDEPDAVARLVARASTSRS